MSTSRRIGLPLPQLPSEGSDLAGMFDRQFEHSRVMAASHAPVPLQEEVDRTMNGRRGAWYLEHLAHRAGSELVGQLVSPRYWGEDVNPAAHDGLFRELADVHPYAGGYTYVYANGARERVPGDAVVVVKLGMYTDNGLGITDSEGEQVGYLIPWPGEEQTRNPIWDVWLHTAQGPDEQLANGVPLAIGRSLLTGTTRRELKRA